MWTPLQYCWARGGGLRAGGADVPRGRSPAVLPDHQPGSPARLGHPTRSSHPADGARGWWIQRDTKCHQMLHSGCNTLPTHDPTRWKAGHARIRGTVILPLEHRTGRRRLAAYNQTRSPGTPGLTGKSNFCRRFKTPTRGTTLHDRSGACWHEAEARLSLCTCRFYGLSLCTCKFYGAVCRDG